MKQGEVKMSRKILVCLAMFLLFAGPEAIGYVHYRAVCPEAENGSIPVSTDFSIEIWIESDIDLLGGVFGVYFYGKNGLTHITHVGSGGDGVFHSIDYLNDFAPEFVFLNENGFDGNLPDSFNLAFLTFEGWIPGEAPDQPYIRFNLRADEPGRICIDSGAGWPENNWDWNFPWGYEPVTFSGPYCWTIGEIPDAPPQIECPDTISLYCDDYGQVQINSVPRAVDDNDPHPLITYEDDTSGTCHRELNRLWIASDSSGQKDSCHQIITIDDGGRPVINCPTDLEVNPDENIDPAFTGYPEAWDCDPDLVIDYIDFEFTPGIISRLWRATDWCGGTSVCLQTITIRTGGNEPTGVAEENSRDLPQKYDLYQNYPNPFNAATEISFDLPRITPWKLTVFDLLGRIVSENEGQGGPGTITVKWDDAGCSSGIYFYRLEAGGEFSAARKMILLK